MDAGLLVEPENAEALGTVLGWLLVDEGLRRRLGEAERRAVVREGSWERIAARLGSVLETALHERRGM